MTLQNVGKCGTLIGLAKGKNNYSPCCHGLRLFQSGNPPTDVVKKLAKILVGALLQNGFQTLRRWVGLNTFVGEVIKPKLWYALPGDYFCGVKRCS